ncbi:MAG: SRPBCC domain-containing protein [Bacteroidetes bacterium]|nr:SRPBCC domain-containing protein [Bacteroidota bacterium]
MMDKIKFELEFPLRASPKMLFPFLSTPSGLSEWFCDDVNSRTELFTFFWDGSEEQARLLKKQSDKMVRYRWLNDEEDGLDTYFEFRSEVDALTNDTSIIVTDFAQADEVDESKLLWESQIHELQHIIGA